MPVNPRRRSSLFATPPAALPRPLGVRVVRNESPHGRSSSTGAALRCAVCRDERCTSQLLVLIHFGYDAVKVRKAKLLRVGRG